ncbi:MAG: ABC transporter permease [Lachnospiraceae bacterium]|nr:ABC transporter permease [Lachnospiraceae bacterium]
MKFRWNPIVKKDLTITSRSMRFSWGLFAYEVILMIVFLFALRILGYTSRYSASSNAQALSSFVSMFPVVSIAEICIVALIVPITCAPSITGEKERQTFDIMLTTQIRPMQIITGKMMSAISRIMMYVIASIPIMAVGFTIGGISWFALLFYLLMVVVLCILEGSISMFASAVCRKSVTAIILTYVMLFLLYGMTFAPLLFAAIYDATSAGYNSIFGELLVTIGLVALFPNPIMTFIEFYTHVIAGESFAVKSIAEEGLKGTEILATGILWIVISVAVILLISYFFMQLAAYKIDPMHATGGKSGKQPKKGPQIQQPVQQSIQQPVQQPMQQPMQQPIQQAIQQPMQQSIQQPMQQPMQQPIQQPMQQPMQQSGQQEIQ